MPSPRCSPRAGLIILARWPVLAAVLAVLVSCGGGGDDDGSIGGTSIGLAPSSSLAQICAAPRPSGTIDPFTGRPYGDVQGTLDDEKAFLRSWIDETYLWYQDVRALSATTLDPARYATPLDYFDALKSPLTTASGKPKDQFHFTYDTPTWVALAQSGVSFGYGIELAFLSRSAPRNAVVAIVQPGSPAAAAGIARGAVLVAVDGVDFVNGPRAPINAGLFPTVAGTHTLTIRDLGASADRTVTLSAQAITSTPVQNVRTLPAPNASVGYMLFNDHIATSEAQLVAGINTLKAAGVTDLVLDIRYNGGGYLDIAAELAYMIAGPAQTAGKFFERLNYNDRNPFNQSTAQATTGFLSSGQGFSVSTGTALPTLGLSRVYVLTSADTCSASEAIINGLRGAGVTVNTIGATTCGKPYGFYPRDNCGTTYFAIQFQGVNNVGFGSYGDGFAPTCPVADDFSKALGDPTENQLEVALGLRNTGVCTPPIAGIQKQQATTKSAPTLIRNPARENRIYR
ncbi:MAG: S41 family peptidase [Caldimonas sp.]